MKRHINSKKRDFSTFEEHLAQELKDDKFRESYELEYAKVALIQRIAELRGEPSIRQIELAKRMKVSQQFISQIESGEAKNLTIETILKIARALGRDVTITFPKSHGEFKFKVA